MIRLLSPRRFTVTTAILLACSGFALLYTSLPPFDEYGQMFAGFLPNGLTAFLQESKLAVAATLGTVTLLSFVFYNLSVWLAGNRLESLIIHRWDYFYTVMIEIALLVLCAEQYILYRYHALANLVLFLCSFVLLMHLWTTTLVRIHARTLVETMYWSTVFKTIEPRSFTGIFILVALCSATFVFLENCYSFLHEITGMAFYLDSGPQAYLMRFFITICLPIIVLILISVLCRSIINLTAERERIVEEKLAAERFRTELITNVTHDIRTPLTSIINYVDLIDKLKIDDDKLQEYTLVLQNKTVRLKSLVSDLLDASKASTGTMDVTIEPLDLSELIGQVVGDFDDALLEAKLTYVNPCSDKQIIILADGSLLWRVLENLFSNIIKYAMPGTRVYVEIEEDTERVKLAIKNTSKDKLNIGPEELLQQFARGDQARSEEGNGLGLFIAERLTSLMDAQLTLAINADLFEAHLVFKKPRST